MTDAMDPAPGSESDPTRPNIILILADDMGFSDLGCMGSEISTPHLDSIAEDGVLLTQMYNNARCCPSRASLLTGLTPHQTGVGHMLQDLGHPSYSTSINEKCVTIAEALGAAGYRTYLTGKWHLGGRYVRVAEKESWQPGAPGQPRPIDRGFDEHYGTLGGMASYFYPHDLIENDEWVEDPGADFYYTDAITERAVDLIEESSAGGDPFFLFVSHIAPHWPLHASEEDIEPYRTTYEAGWDEIRRQRYERMLEKGVIDESFGLSDRDELTPPWDEAENKEWEAARMAVYAAQVSRMDSSVGVILDALKRNGLEDNTIVVFLSDNGGCAELLYEDGIKGKAVDTTRDGDPVKIGNDPSVMPGPQDTFQSYGRSWANVSNTPFRLFKHWVHEGGIATPMLVRWPGMADAGTIRHEPCHLTDIMPTFLEAAGAEYPDSREDLPALEGESLASMLAGEPWSRSRPIAWEHEGNRAVRAGNWKLVSRNPRGWELYDMSSDRSELDDLADVHPDVVEELDAYYRAWADRTGVVPWETVSEWLVEAGEATREQIERWTRT